MREDLTPKGVLLGLLLAAVFGLANAYLALRLGMTVSASIPAAVLAVAFLKPLRGTLREFNMVQTVASAGESLAAGVAFTVPAFFILGHRPSYALVVLLAVAGGFLGVASLSLVRRRFVEEENLPYPEGRACAEVLRAGQGRGAGKLLVSGTLAFVYRGLGWLGLLNQRPGLAAGWTFFSVDLTPAVLGAGTILGVRTALLVAAGGALGWLGLVPLISALKGVAVNSASAADSLWADYLRFIGAGAVLVGGLFSLGKALPAAARGISLRGGRDIPPWTLGAVALSVLPVLWWASGPLGAALGLAFAFVFAVVSARVVGIVGSSSNPVSGMTVTAVLLSSVAMAGLKAGGVLAALGLASVVCVAAAIAGDTSQDLMTGHLVGAVPKAQQIGELAGVLVSALAVGWAVFLLADAFGFGGELRAPQANVMAIITEGVFTGKVPWVLLGAGGAIALAVEMLGVSSLAFAVGLYLPLDLSAGLLLGALLGRLFRVQEAVVPSGLIAGDALSGLAAAAWKVWG